MAVGQTATVYRPYCSMGIIGCRGLSRLASYLSGLARSTGTLDKLTTPYIYLYRADYSLYTL